MGVLLDTGVRVSETALLGVTIRVIVRGRRMLRTHIRGRRGIWKRQPLRKGAVMPTLTPGERP